MGGGGGGGGVSHIGLKSAEVSSPVSQSKTNLRSASLLILRLFFSPPRYRYYQCTQTWVAFVLDPQSGPQPSLTFIASISFSLSFWFSVSSLCLSRSPRSCRGNTVICDSNIALNPVTPRRGCHASMSTCSLLSHRRSLEECWASSR